LLVGGLRKYLQLQAQARSGLSSGLLAWGLLAIVFGTLTAAFILLIAFIWLAERYEPLIAASVLAGFFLLVTIIALFCLLRSRRRTIERAELALAARRQTAGSTRSSSPGQFRRAAESAGAGSFRCSRWGFSPSVSEWNDPASSGRATASRMASAGLPVPLEDLRSARAVRCGDCVRGGTHTGCGR
jgi:hypothetical protein